MASNPEYNRVPISALRKASIAALSAGLNQHKIIPSEEGLPRDWRGLAHLLGLNGVETDRVAGASDSVAELIKQCGAQATIERLHQFLALIDRFDVLDDTQALIEEDVKIFLERASSSQHSPLAASSSRDATDSLVLTVDDVARLEKGLDPQTYDAYLLFAEEDIDFASQIVDTMEQQYQMKLCIRDRDLVGGIAFEHEAIMKLIAERCRRLLVVVSKSFLQSPANKFFLTFAQALGIDQRKRKVIPILYERCELPPELSYYFLLDYNRAGVFWDFWGKLRDSIAVTESSNPALQNSSPWMTRTRFQEPQTTQPAIEAPPSAEVGKTAEEEPKKLDADLKKPPVKQLTQSITNLFSSSKERKKEKSESESSSKSSKKKWYKKKKAEPMLS